MGFEGWIGVFPRQEGRWVLQATDLLGLDPGGHIRQVCPTASQRVWVLPIAPSSPPPTAWAVPLGPLSTPGLGLPCFRDILLAVQGMVSLWLGRCPSGQVACPIRGLPFGAFHFPANCPTKWLSWVLSLKNFSPLNANTVPFEMFVLGPAPLMVLSARPPPHTHL